MDSPQTIRANRPRRRLRTLARLLALAVGLLLALEVGLRLLVGLGNPVLYRPDPACGYVLAPEQATRRFFHSVRINSHGMRSAELHEPKPPGEVRILFIGDSVTFGTSHMDQADIFTSILAADLPRQLNRPVEVLNASAGGWAVANELGYLKSRGTFDSDLVVFVLNTGDLVQPFATVNFSLADGYPDHKPLCALSEFWLRYLRPRLARADPGSQPSLVPDVAAQTPEVLASLAEAKALCDQAGAKFAVVYCPARGGEWEQPLYGTALHALKRWAEQRGVQLVDLTADFASRPESPVHIDGIHLTTEGNARFARRIEQERELFLPPPEANAP